MNHQLNENTIPLEGLHELLRHRPEDGAAERIITVERLDDDYSVVSISGLPGREVRIRHQRGAAIVRQMLRHYPVEVRVNHLPVETSDFRALPGISLAWAHPDEFPDGELHYERVTEGQMFGSEILLDGLLYQTTWPRHMLAGGRAAERTVEHLRPHETCFANPPGWSSAKYSPLDTYQMTHQLAVTETTEEERRELTTGAHTSSAFCVPGPRLLRRLRPQIDAARVVVTDHAARTGRTLVDETPDHVRATWSPAYETRPLTVGPAGRPVNIMRDMHPPVAAAVCRAMYPADEHNLVPVSRTGDSDNNGAVGVTAVRWTELGGTERSARAVDARGHEWVGIDRSAPIVAARRIVLTLRVTHQGKDADLDLETDCFTVGTADHPRVLVKTDPPPDRDALARRLAAAYTSRQHIAEGSEEAVQAGMRALAIRITEGDTAAFTEELRQLAGSFRTRTRRPARPVTVPAAGGGTISWAPEPPGRAGG